MDKIVLNTISIFFVIGAIDYILGNKLRIGEKFQQGIAVMGTMFLAIAGIYSLSPVISSFMQNMFSVMEKYIYIDPSLFPSMLLATDMGGYDISYALATSSGMGIFSGIMLSSMMGTTVSFTIPVAMTLIKEEDTEYFIRGALAGMSSIPLGCFVAGIMMGIDIKLLMINEIPIIIVVMIIIMCMKRNYKGLIKAFKGFGKIITYIGVLGLILQGVNIISGKSIFLGLASPEDVMFLCGKIGVVLGGAYPMISVISRVFEKQFHRIGRKAGINSVTVAGIIGGFATNLLIFASFKDMNDNGKIMASAFSITGAFVFGGQMGFVASKTPEVLSIFIITKIISGCLSIAFAKMFFTEYEKEEQVVL